MKLRQLIFTVGVTTLCLFLQFFVRKHTLIVNYSETQNPYISHSTSSQSNPNQQGGKTKKLIVLWTKFFGSFNGWFSFYGSPVKRCSKTCTFSHNRSQLAHADAILINAVNLYEKEQDLPGTRSSKQVWILHNTECPTKTWLNMEKFNNIFNWTSMVRSDSDVPVFYGKTAIGSQSDNVELSGRSAFQKKTAAIAWAVGNCFSTNSREEYVRELQRHISIDIYGHCGRQRLKCPHGQELHCLSKYKFYLAFENSHCKDYITEKLWRTYTLGSIPVVRGGGNYTKVAPPGSYINTEDFKSPKHLADYLLQVSSDEQLYMSYMKWHKTHKLLLQDGQYWCDLCEALHRRQGQRQVYRRLGDWFQLDTCHLSWVCISLCENKPLMNLKV